ncbi:hypothetical protein ELJ38_30565, partial [Klebsiella pneumoniae]|nr:hypothetical protein [Klebsiella pneumoniae]
CREFKLDSDVTLPHTHQLKNSELPQNEKKNFLLQINKKFFLKVLKNFNITIFFNKKTKTA